MNDTRLTFAQLGLSEPLLKALTDVGYETPSPIQALAIPPLLKGRDVLGQAQTGTGKTAAFALPILQQLDLSKKHPQLLVLAPTRELAIQVAEAFQTYAHHLPGFHIAPIYGGSGYEKQIQALKRGVQVVVGTPGRVMDHMRKGTLKLDKIKHFVLDEGDEMLRMGFIDDVEWILSHAPAERQIALFSATMPKAIAKVAHTYLNNPEHVKIEVKTTTAETIRQRYWSVSGLHKLDAITRILEVEEFDGMIIFVRTKTATVELTEKLEARGYRAAALNGDIAQNLRERTIERLKGGQIDILVATDVAARGLDVERISHVLNYDIPYDTEAYVHRIGRTGRAGRSGQAILFVAKREMRMLQSIERATGQTITPMKLPSAADINQHRVVKFKQKILDMLNSEEIIQYRDLIDEVQQESAQTLLDIAAALMALYQGSQPLLLKDKPEQQERDFGDRDRDRDRGRERDGKSRDRDFGEGRKPRPRGEKSRDFDDRPDFKKDRERKGKSNDVDGSMVTYRVEVGRNDGVRPGDLVGAIANEAGLGSSSIGHIKIHDDYCTVDLPDGMPKEVFKVLQKVWVCQRQLKLSLVKTAGGGTKKYASFAGSDDARSEDGGDSSSDRPASKRAPAKKRFK